MEFPAFFRQSFCVISDRMKQLLGLFRLPGACCQQSQFPNMDAEGQQIQDVSSSSLLIGFSTPPRSFAPKRFLFFFRVEPFQFALLTASGCFSSFQKTLVARLRRSGPLSRWAFCHHQHLSPFQDSALALCPEPFYCDFSGVPRSSF